MSLLTFNIPVSDKSVRNRFECCFAAALKGEAKDEPITQPTQRQLQIRRIEHFYRFISRYPQVASSRIEVAMSQTPAPE
ncbi:hypothetical protein ED28_08725 [[Pantoea] beijingensis]|uniref:Uncharacterized protein n=1 Tax=[Pantoea] beijingensis TaxID=1324864 RepID=A0A443IEH2_9GAMM|nr:hypothetical protein ED28_08725 [[Pantoea] beijingensis]